MDVTSFLEFSFCGERTHSDFSFRGDDLEFGEAAGRPAERGLRVLLHSRGLSGRRDMSRVKEMFGSFL
jgi:hypothetical protein